MITEEIIKKVQAGGFISVGYCEIEHPWFNDAKATLFSGKNTIVKYVMVRTHLGFKVYHSLNANLEPADYLDGVSHLKRSFEDVYKYGAKMSSSQVSESFFFKYVLIKKYYDN